jgi:uncharacterized protein with PQ loop repeat
MTASCFVWIVYGILKQEPTIYLTNCIELLLSVYYFVEFTNYAPLKSPTFPGSVYSHIQVCGGIWGLSVLMAVLRAVDMVGYLTVVLTILTFASPLAAVKAVLESQSSEAIPWHFTLAAFINCCLWTVVGVWGMHDVFVYLPAVLGLLFSSVQIALKLKYADHHDYSTHATTAPVEMKNPVLKSVRQVVMYGNDDTQSIIHHGLHDLHLAVSSNSSNYVELRAPLVNDEDGVADDANNNVPLPPPPVFPSPSGTFRS